MLDDRPVKKGAVSSLDDDRILERLVPPEVRTAYERDGVVKIEEALSETEISLLRQAVDRQIEAADQSPTAYDFQHIAEQIWRKSDSIDAKAATRFDMVKFKRLIDLDADARALFDEAVDGAPKGRFLYEAAGWRRHPEIREVAMDSALPEIVASLMQSAYVNFWEDTTFVKTPGATQRTAFHQDYTYFQITGRKCCIAWIALDPADGETGALEYVRGSHRWGREFAPNLLISQTITSGSAGDKLPDIEANREVFDIIRIDAKPGDVILHDVLVIHGSGGNKSADRTRRGISFRYCGDDVRYADKPGAIAQPWVKKKPANGAALYSIDYPRVWPRPFPGARISRLFNRLAE